MNKSKYELTPYDRLKSQFKTDGMGRYKTADAMAVAGQIDDERKRLARQVAKLKHEIKIIKQFQREELRREELAIFTENISKK
tara:strand:+ start:1605 stop:1853 length:249 start_codon:yes stop_codon:yes gene_type:complete